MADSLILNLREEFEPRLFGAAGGLFEKASWAQCRLLGAWLGLVMHGALGKRREVASANIRLAFPQLNRAQANQMARRACMNFGMTFAEFTHLKTASAQEIRDYCSIPQLEHITDGLAAGKGVILSTAHLGNWEVMGARAAQEFPIAVVARPSRNVGIQAHIEAQRKAVGVRIISKYDTGRASLKALRENSTLGILPDQHAGPTGLLLPMFGQPTRVVPAIARLALLSGATVVPSYGVRRRPWLADGRIVATTFPGWTIPRTAKTEDDKARLVEEGTLRVIHDLEIIMRAHPDQWLWLHRRWRPMDGAVLPA